MGRGSSKVGGGGGTGGGGTSANSLQNQAMQNISGMSGYNVTRSDGVNMDFFFQVQDGVTYYSNSIGEIPQPTPNNWTESEMIDNIKRFGGTVNQYSKNQMVNMEMQRLQGRQQMNTFLNQQYVRNSGADIGARSYRNTRRAQRIARRNP